MLVLQKCTACNMSTGPVTSSSDASRRAPHCSMHAAAAAHQTRLLCSCANTGVVCLGASQTTGTYLMPRLISVYRQSNQEVALQLQV